MPTPHCTLAPLPIQPRASRPGVRAPVSRGRGRSFQGYKMARRRQIYEGKAKILYEGPEPGTLIQYFKDDATAFNAQKKGTISGKGVLNNRISEQIRSEERRVGKECVRKCRFRRCRYT